MNNAELNRTVINARSISRSRDRRLLAARLLRNFLRRKIVAWRLTALRLCEILPLKKNITGGCVSGGERPFSSFEDDASLASRAAWLHYAGGLTQGEVAAQVAGIYESFNADAAKRTCKSCGYVFPTTPMAERLGFLRS